MSGVGKSVRRRDLTWAAAFVLLLGGVWVARGDLAEAGLEPPGEGIRLVYLAAGANFPDALGVGPGGGINGAPLIIVPTDPPLPSPTAAELVRLDPTRLVIIGGFAVISAAMEAEIAALLPNAAVERIAGSNRYETNALFSAEVFPVEGWASVPAPAFTTEFPATDGAQILNTLATNLDSGILWAPVQLPHGAEILELRLAGYDGVGEEANDVVATLERITDGGTSEAMATVSSSGAPMSFVVSTEAMSSGSEIVDNEHYAYVIKIVHPLVGIGSPYAVTKVMVRYRVGPPSG